MTVPLDGPDFTVVLAVSHGAQSADDALHALEAGCEGVAAELVIVVAGNRSVAVRPGTPFTSVTVERCDEGTLTPIQWGAGARLAKGRVVGFTTDQMRVSAGWARALSSALVDKVVGVAGPIGLARGADGATAAAWFLRFSAFAPHVARSGTVRDIPGDNAAYLRSAIEAHADLLAEGFWEVEFHRRFEREGLMLRMVPEAPSMLVGPVPFGGMIEQRFRHGVEFGMTRVERHGESRLKLVVASPLVPFVLVRRILTRTLDSHEARGRFFASLPRLGLLTASWALGEAVGAWRGRTRSRPVG